MLFRFITLILLGSTFGACAPNVSPSEVSPSQPQGVWVKQSVAHNLRSTDKTQCGSLISTTPTAFSIDETGTVQLLIRNEMPLEIGHISPDGRFSNPDLFMRVDLFGEQLNLQSSDDTQPIRYVRSSLNEANHFLSVLEECVNNLDKTSVEAQDLENRAVLTKNKIQLAIAESQQHSPRSIALAALLSGGILNSIYAGFEAYDAATAFTAATDANYTTEVAEIPRLREMVQRDTALVFQEFQKLKTELQSRLPRDAVWSPVKPGKYQGLVNEIMYFKGAYKTQSMRGHLKLTAKQQERLQSMRTELSFIKAAGRVSLYSKDHLRELYNQSLRSNKYLKVSLWGVVAISGLYLASEAHAYFSQVQQAARDPRLAPLLALNDDDLRIEIRKDPSLVQLLIEAGE